MNFFACIIIDWHVGECNEGFWTCVDNVTCNAMVQLIATMSLTKMIAI